MTGRKVIFSAVGLVVLLYGYRLYKPLPRDVSSPWESAKLFATLAILDDVAFLGSLLGLGSTLNITRALLESTGSTLNNVPLENFKVTDTEFDGVKVRLYMPEDQEPNSPAIVFYHGGGFSTCNLEVHDPVLRMIATQLNIFIVSVDYRLAPENPFPIPFDDCLRATLHFFKNVGRYQIDPKRIAVMGDSAGGNLAAAVSLKLRDTRNAVQPKVQVLVYPLIQGIDLTLPSMLSNDNIAYGSIRGTAACLAHYAGIDEAYIPAIAANRHVSPDLKRIHGHKVDKNLLPEMYLTGETSSDDLKWNKKLSDKLESFLTDPYAMPLMADDLSGLPAAYIVTAEYDVLRDEGIIYAKRLEAQSIPVKHVHYDDAYHSVFNLIDNPFRVEAGVKIVKNIVYYLKEAL